MRINKSWYIALFMVSGFIKKPFWIDYDNIYCFSMFFSNRFCQAEKCAVAPHCSHRDSLTLKSVLKRLLFYLLKEVGRVEKDIMYLMIGRIFVSNHIICTLTAEKMKFSIKDFFSKYDQIRSFLHE